MPGLRPIAPWRWAAAALASLVLLAAPGTGWADEERGTADRIGGAGFDVVFLRPAAITQLAVGGAVCLAAWPLSYFSGRRDAVRESLVTRPYEDAFSRPLGEF